MLKHFFVVIIFVSFCCFLYGITNIFLEVEENSCRMTYMFEKPQFLRLKVNQNEKFPDYGLYYYYEGRLQNDIRAVNFNGAPVIFVPGNGGSFKQVRSLASVALRKSMDNDDKIHLDYFTIDYNEELSGLYGGYIQKQKEFLKICIKTVLQLKKDSFSKIVLIGHSMGGKIAQAILTEIDVANVISTIISVSSPLDSPVLNIDAEMNSFYATTNNFLSEHHTSYRADNETNPIKPHKHVNSSVENILLISIGGGNRDLLVRDGLTISRFSDVHAMTSSIPRVWLSCDHLSSVWCLQLVLVINRFLFNIASLNKHNYVLFNENRTIGLHAASHFFVESRNRPKIFEIELLKKSESERTWHVDSKRVFGKQFTNGLRQSYKQMLELAKFEKFKKLYVEVKNLDDHNWIFGCTANISLSGKSVCERGTSLSHYIKSIPSRLEDRSMVILDLHNIKKTYLTWTHIVIYLPPKNKQIYLNFDIHDPVERNLRITAPRWFILDKKYIVDETAQGTIYYKLLISGVSDHFQTFKVNIEAITCTRNTYEITAKISFPWARGFVRYHTLNENTSKDGIYVNAPIASSHGFNTSENAVKMEFFLDPSCRFSISYQFSVAATMSKMVREFYQWLPSHLTAVLIIALKNQLSKIRTEQSLNPVVSFSGFFQYTSLYIITGCRLVKKVLLPIKALPVSSVPNHSFYPYVIVHSTAIILSIIITFGLWMAVMLHGNLIYKIGLRFCKISFDTSSVLVSTMTTFPIAFGVLAAAITLSCSNGVALIIACIVYFLMLSNAYKEYLQNWIWTAAKNILKNSGQSTNCQDLSEQDQNNESDRDESNSLTQATSEKDANNCSKCKGLQNFPFHIIMFLLLFVLTALNAVGSVAWIKNHSTQPSPDSVLVSLVVFTCLSLMWQMETPNKSNGSKCVSVLLYGCAAACILYCQEEVYRLSYIIAFVYVIILLQELLGKMHYL